MNLETITKLINHLDITPITSLRKCAQAINVNVSTLIRSLLNVLQNKNEEVVSLIEKLISIVELILFFIIEIIDSFFISKN